VDHCSKSETIKEAWNAKIEFTDKQRSDAGNISMEMPVFRFTKN
jgi:hypothetical protein